MNKQDLILLGAGRHAAVILDTISRLDDFACVGLLDDTHAMGSRVSAIQVLGPMTGIRKATRQFPHAQFLIGVGANHARQKIAAMAELEDPGIKWATICHPSAVISKTAQIGPGTVVFAGAVIQTDCVLGRHVLINTASVIEHDTVFGDFASTGPRAATGGNVRVGSCSHLGIGSTVQQKITIGEATILGGQAYANRDLRSHSVYFGVPAKWIRERSPDDAYL